MSNPNLLPAVLAISITAVLAGCSAPAPELVVSADCTAAIQVLTDLPADATTDDEDAAIGRSATACKTWAEYIAAVEANPQSWLFKDSDAARAGAATISASVCRVAGSSPVCEDARNTGVTN